MVPMVSSDTPTLDTGQGALDTTLGTDPDNWHPGAPGQSEFSAPSDDKITPGPALAPALAASDHAPAPGAPPHPVMFIIVSHETKTSEKHTEIMIWQNCRCTESTMLNIDRNEENQALDRLK